MSLLEIVLAFIALLYAVVIHRALTNIDIVNKKANVMYEELIGHLENLRQSHNFLVDKQAEVIEEYSTKVLSDVNKQLEDANCRYASNNKRLLEELDYVKKVVKLFLRGN